MLVAHPLVAHTHDDEVGLLGLLNDTIRHVTSDRGRHRPDARRLVGLGGPLAELMR